MIGIESLTKTYGVTRAVDGVSFSAPTGAVTGFLGPNGAGKTTTLRVLLGLARPDSGTALIDATPYGGLSEPRRKVGAVLDHAGFHPGRSGEQHLRIVACGARLPGRRVGEVLEFAGLTPARRHKVGGYSQGMRQRLALATALLGDPPVLVLDEPATGLDPAGIAWLRTQMRQWADQGRTVLFSSHVLAEVETVADQIVIINEGRVIRSGTTSEVTAGAGGVAVRTADKERLAALAKDRGWTVQSNGDGRLIIGGALPEEIGRLAASADMVLSELAGEARGRQLEDVFLELTKTEVKQ